MVNIFYYILFNDGYNIVRDEEQTRDFTKNMEYSTVTVIKCYRPY
jgi:hypothetical protein